MVLSGKMELHPLPRGTRAAVDGAAAAPAVPRHAALRHRMVALEDTDVVEVSTTELEDVVRLEDNYGRKGTSAP